MTKIVRYLLLLLLSFPSCQEPEVSYVNLDPVTVEEPREALPPDGNVVVGYMTYWDTTLPDVSLLTHICYAFAHIKSDFASLDVKNESRLASIAALKEKKPELKVLLSVGGWGAGNFSEMAADERTRSRFCNNCLEVVKKYGLDGIDLDWEYPTSSVAGISSSSEDTRNFTLLLKNLREVLGNDRLITMASADNAKYVDFRSAVFYLNFVNVMAYDMGRPPYHNAALHPSEMSQMSCEEAVNLHYKAGVPYGKIVLGIPFFGRADGKAFGGEDEVAFRDISTKGYVVKWDETAQVPYLTDKDGVMVLTYDDEKSVGLKADYIREKELLGAMYWNVEADNASWTLSKAIASRLLSKK
ncbi:MAG: glycoside hydrolase [Bacteroidales bacterium]|nr:glycoside hydrolase [Bacteroidales bacterium]